MMKSRHHLTLIDMMATVAAAALVTGVFVWGGMPPGHELDFVAWLSVPLVGIVWDRWRGRSGILGGALGGAAEAGLGLIWELTGPHRPGQMGPSYFARHPIAVVFVIAGCVLFGTLMGVATWLVAAAMGQSVASKVPSPNDQFVRQR